MFPFDDAIMMHNSQYDDAFLTSYHNMNLELLQYSYKGILVFGWYILHVSSLLQKIRYAAPANAHRTEQQIE